GLLCWIAIRKLGIVGLFVYMDDFFGWDYEGHTVVYKGHTFTRKQAQLLVLWDAISCPWEARKQQFAGQLTIIGFHINANLGTISLPPSAIAKALEDIDRFLAHPKRQPALRDWQRLAGRLNWLLNVLPWGRPALTELYRKMSGKTQSFRAIYLNRDVISDLTWFKQTIPRSIGVRFVDNGRWAISEADI
ncbi:uncharacterized protein B0H18DRAFT_836936, partial [Fomitopsis serialis]|uniref:uncharacterized protein n=1 Tax=Fomitopsis serialis TaxID=139415 RepID=UPI002008390B